MLIEPFTIALQALWQNTKLSIQFSEQVTCFDIHFALLSSYKTHRHA